MTDLAVQKLINKRIKIAIILSNVDSNMKIGVYTWRKRKEISCIHYIDTIRKISLSSNILLKSSSCCSSTINLGNNTNVSSFQLEEEAPWLGKEWPLCFWYLTVIACHSEKVWSKLFKYAFHICMVICTAKCPTNISSSITYMRSNAMWTPSNVIM